jgi:hypothetical protein
MTRTPSALQQYRNTKQMIVRIHGSTKEQIAEDEMEELIGRLVDEIISQAKGDRCDAGLLSRALALDIFKLIETKIREPQK